MATRERIHIPARLRKAGIASAGDNVGKGQRVAAPARLIAQTFKRELMDRLLERGGTHGAADMKYTLIDAPVTRWSDASDIKAWLEELEALEHTPEVRRALDMAREWLEDATRRERAGDGSES